MVFLVRERGWCVLRPGQALRYGIASLLTAALLWGQSREAEIRAHFERAEKAQQQGDLQAAARELQKAIQLNPSEAEAHARLGMIYNRLGKLPESTESYELALRLDPKLPRLNVLLAFNYMAAGRCRDAIPLLAANFEAEADSPVRLLVGQRLVECYSATGDQEQVLALVQKLRQIRPDDPDVLYTALKTYMNLWTEAFQRLTA